VYVALRDLRHARGRFALIGTVVVLVAMLVTFLSSLTAGLARASVSALTDLPADHLAFGAAAPGDAPDLTSSRVTRDQWEAWAAEPGVLDAQPLGVATTRATSGATTVAVTALGVPPGSDLAPGGGPDDGQVVLTERGAEELGLAAGDVLTLGGTDLTVDRVVADDAQLAHTPVAWASLADHHRHAGRCPQRRLLLHRREPVAHHHAGVPRGDLRAGRRGVLHRLDDQPPG
jgi:putative ABC transport system permease protein